MDGCMVGGIDLSERVLLLLMVLCRSIASTKYKLGMADGESYEWSSGQARRRFAWNIVRLFRSPLRLDSAFNTGII